MRIIEPFSRYAELKRGVPWLAINVCGKLSHVQWGDGTLIDCHIFSAALPHEVLNNALTAIWERDKSSFGKKATLFIGGVGGGAVSIPSHTAMRMYTDILVMFEMALRWMAEAGIGGLMTWEKRCALIDKLTARRDEMVNASYGRVSSG